jgi:hypothetical protein
LASKRRLPEAPMETPYGQDTQPTSGRQPKRLSELTQTAGRLAALIASLDSRTTPIDILTCRTHCRTIAASLCPETSLQKFQVE